MALSTTDAAHLLRRTGFGVTPARLQELTALPSRSAAIDRVTDLSLAPPANDSPVGPGPIEEQYVAWYQLCWRSQLATKKRTRGSALAYFLVQSTAVGRWHDADLASALYVGMLHRAPSKSAWTTRLNQLKGGTPLRSLVAEFFGTAEYRARFT